MTERHGKYIVIEGHDGTGKSSQVQRIQKALLKHGIESVELSEPAKDPADGGPDEVQIADAIRSVIKNGSLQRDAITNLFLFSASRHELWHQKAIPALKMGKWVVAARNYYSTLAYQGYGEGLDLQLIKDMTAVATDERYMSPDIAIVLDLDDEQTRLERIKSRGPLDNPDTFESKGDDFQRRVKDAYLEIAHTHGIPVLSASKSIPEVTNDIWSTIEPQL